MTDYDPADDGFRCYELALRAWRESEIRAGYIKPRHDHPEELEWAAEGVVGHPKELATLKAEMTFAPKGDEREMSRP